MIKIQPNLVKLICKHLFVCAVALIGVKIFRNGYLVIRRKICFLYFSENNILTEVIGVVG